MIRRLFFPLWTRWQEGLRPNSPAAYLFAFACVGITLAARLIFSAIVGGAALFVIYFPAVLVSALIGGVGAGAAALVLGGIAGWTGFIWPSSTFLVPSMAQGVGLGAYFVSGALIVWVADSHRGAIRDLRAEEAFS